MRIYSKEKEKARSDGGEGGLIVGGEVGGGILSDTTPEQGNAIQERA